ncbi:MAG: toll/interleukin-1 receptor domain-containing protein [Candidatus Omnitrophota bacterium]
MSETTKDDKNIKTVNPLVFISHDTRDAQLAETFSELLKKVSAGVLKSFRTSDKKGTQGIEYGIEWYPEIIKNIQNASDVVCLLTDNSINRPWLLFEAGMAKGKLDTSILGIALGIPLQNASTGPFAQFQNCADDEDSLTKLVLQLLKRIPNSEPDEGTIKTQVKEFKEKISKILQTAPKNKKSDSQSVTPNKDDSSAKLFEEIKIMFQDLPDRIESNLRSDKRRKRKFHPMMIDELIHMSKNRTIGIMMALSLFKDSMPWLYDIGVETIKTIKIAKTKEAKRMALSEFQEVIELSTHHPIMREFYMNAEEDHMMLREIPRMLMKNIDRLIIDEE